MTHLPAFGATSPTSVLEHMLIGRRAVGAQDVQIEIEFCGVCHTDIHMVRDDWGGANYPVVPGHEVVGKVTSVGADVLDLKVGQRVAVGCFVDSCRTCSSCKLDLEQYCLNGFTATYGSPTEDEGGFTYGGYSESIVVDRHFVLTVPENLDPAGAAPLLCAGITTYSPLKHWNVGPGMTVGIIGLGGLGHMGVKFAHAMGAHTVMITTSEKKGADAKALGADEVLLSTDEEAMASMAGKFDFLLNTIPVQHNTNIYMSLLTIDGTMCVVGSVGPTGELDTAPLIFGRRKLAGSLVGGIKETQDMLDFCGQHNITSDIELINMQSINEAYERMLKSDVKYRFVIDMKSLSGASE
jgi:uncharacterized zinc-type alcohol dehydrogenase-like protein